MTCKSTNGCTGSRTRSYIDCNKRTVSLSLSLATYFHWPYIFPYRCFKLDSSVVSYWLKYAYTKYIWPLRAAYQKKALYDMIAYIWLKNIISYIKPYMITVTSASKGCLCGAVYVFCKDADSQPKHMDITPILIIEPLQKTTSARIHNVDTNIAPPDSWVQLVQIQNNSSEMVPIMHFVKLAQTAQQWPL